MFIHPLYVCTPHVCVPPGVYTPPICPHTPVYLYVLRGFACFGGKGLPFVLGHFPYTTLYGGASLQLHPHTQLLVPCASICFRDISMICGHFPFCWGVWGCSPSVGGLGASALEMSICSFCYISVVHYVSCFEYGSDYYSSGYSGIFWPVISVISHSGSFPDRVSSKLGSAWSGSTTTLDAERLWRCSWLSFCAIAANFLFNASSGLCQLSYGFSTGRFLFQNWASYHSVYYMFGVHSGICFLLLGAKLDALFTYGGSTIRVCTFATLWSLPMVGICASW